MQLSAQQRDALFAQILLDLSGFVDLERAIEKGDLEDAYKLGRKISDGMRLVVDGLGWAHTTSEPVELTIPPSELSMILQRMRAQIEAHYESMRADQEEARAEWDDVGMARDACTAALDQIHSWE